jgi:NAD(P)-dependent dehydrogenase (short-subunit alcohol dehydrogenase family)
MGRNTARFAHEVAIEKEVPLGRLRTIEGVAAATAWVCSDEAYMTGQNLQINGGLSLRRLPTMKELDLT